jgi:UDP-galactopyranose mutase
MSIQRYDFLIVGAGLYGSVFAREATNRGKKVLVIDSRNHIGGNCYTKKMHGINVHEYGPHIFHTNNKEVWNYVNQLAEFNSYQHHIKVKYFDYSSDKIYSFPINMMTFHQLWGIIQPKEAKQRIEEVRIKIENPQNLEEYALSQVGGEIYEKFIYGYTKKQWGKNPIELPIDIIKRIPIRYTYNDNAYDDAYQGIPIGGYTQIFDKLLKGIDVQLETDYLDDHNRFNVLADRIIYTGKIDEFYNYIYGPLEYRAMNFQHIIAYDDFQGVAQMNYTKEDIPQTRIIEHKHFEFIQGRESIITVETPGYGMDCYPINNQLNNRIYEQYSKIENSNIIFGGRLGGYHYLNMDNTIGEALDLVRRIL